MSGLRYLRVEVSDLHEPGLLATLNPGGARPPHVLRVRPGPALHPNPNWLRHRRLTCGFFKVLLLYRLQSRDTAIHHTIEFMIDIHAQHVRFVFARFFEGIELAAQ